MPRAEFLLIDNSNSFTKFALSSRDELGPVRKCATRELDSRALHRVLRGWRFETADQPTLAGTEGEHHRGKR